MLTIDTLNNLSFNVVRNNLQLLYCQNQNANLENIPIFTHVICELVLNHAPFDLHPNIICNFFQTGIKTVILSPYDHDLPVENISKVCKGIMRMDLSFSKISEKNLQNLVQNLSSIVILCLSCTETTDYVLKIIAISCPYLEILDISDSLITDYGLSQFANQGKCKNLKKFNILNLNVSTDTVILLLEQFSLWDLKTNPIILLTAICQYLKYNTDQLYLRELYLSTTKYDVITILNAFTYLESLVVDKCVIWNDHIPNLRTFNHLKRLSLVGEKMDKSLTFEGLDQFLSDSGKTLTELRLDNFEYVNIFLIGIYCKNLQILELSSILHLYYNDFQNNPINPLYNSLKLLKMENFSGDPWDDCLLNLFRNCTNLQYLSITSMTCIDDILLFEIAPYLKSIRILNIVNCENFNKCAVYAAIDKFPQLNTFWIKTKKNILSHRELAFLKIHTMSKLQFYYQYETLVENCLSDDISVDMEEMMFF